MMAHQQRVAAVAQARRRQRVVVASNNNNDDNNNSSSVASRRRGTTEVGNDARRRSRPVVQGTIRTTLRRVVCLSLRLVSRVWNISRLDICPQTYLPEQFSPQTISLGHFCPAVTPDPNRSSTHQVCTCNNNNKHDNVYGAVIMAEPLREFTRFI